MKAQTTHEEKIAEASVRFAFYGRVSTEDNQDPTLSLPRQLANCERAVEEAGGRVVAHFYDVESGAMRLDQRGSGKGLVGFDIPIPRDGGLSDLIKEAPSRAFDAVVCESINRLARNPSVTFRVEEQLADEGVRLWAIDEPLDESFGFHPSAPRQRRASARLPV
jgi:site-specific DNA recombinase